MEIAAGSWRSGLERAFLCLDHACGLSHLSGDTFLPGFQSAMAGVHQISLTTRCAESLLSFLLGSSGHHHLVRPFSCLLGSACLTEAGGRGLCGGCGRAGAGRLQGPLERQALEQVAEAGWECVSGEGLQDVATQNMETSGHSGHGDLLSAGEHDRRYGSWAGDFRNQLSAKTTGL